MKNLILPALLVFAGAAAFAQTNPAITSWIVNTNGQTGFGGISTNVQQVQYSTNNVYISTFDIADWIAVGYDWPNNPWFPENQNFVFRITLHPQPNTGTPVEPPYGHIGIWTNGVSIYNPKDAKTWLDKDTWYQNAFYFEHLGTETMDSCLGHPNGMHEYHLHVHPRCLYDETNTSEHAPLIGFAFDGYPVYGAHGYQHTNGTGPIVRMRTSFRLRTMTDRTTLPDGTVLTPDLYGPDFSVYPPGAYVQDYEYVPGYGDLDEHNGRFCVTPEYPNGTYAYFVTLDSLLQPEYPYVLGTSFYGKTQPGNMGPNSGHVTITEPVNVFTAVDDPEGTFDCTLFPNPASGEQSLYVPPAGLGTLQIALYNGNGQLVRPLSTISEGMWYHYSVADLPTGLYLLRLQSGHQTLVKKMMVSR